MNFNCVRMELTSCNKNFTLYGRASVLCSFLQYSKRKGHFVVPAVTCFFITLIC